MGSRLTATGVREAIDHPVIDGDMHWLQPLPVFLAFLDEVGGGRAVDSYRHMLESDGSHRWYEMTPEERIDTAWMRPGWWTAPANTLDFATASLPQLLRERLDEFGIDFAVLYGSGAYDRIPDPELRQLSCRAYNLMAHTLFEPYSSRITPVAVIPHETPDEALAELDHAIGELGMKSVVIGGHVVRSASPKQLEAGTTGAWNPTTSQYVDFCAMDSPYDYDPVWERCRELGVPVTVHGTSRGWMDRQSPSSFVSNHIGSFGNAHYGFCKALVLGGVSARFPDLRFAFLEGGVAWAVPLYHDIIDHWEKRNRAALDERLRPTMIDVGELRELWMKYGGKTWDTMWDDFIAAPVTGEHGTTFEETAARNASFDEFAAMGSDLGAVHDWFEQSCYFGCEADDRTIGSAFSNHVDLTLRPMFGSDIGHWDVPVMAQVLPEAYELLEDGVLDVKQFRALTCGNVAQLYLDSNPDVFKGTVVEGTDVTDV